MQLHHPDHNNGSLESARRFEEVQEAYAQITRERQRTPSPPRPTPEPPSSDPDVEQRLADLERELREKARTARERAQRAAREAASAYKRPSDEELGIFHTDDSLGKILDDARQEFVQRLGDAREEPISHRVADLLDEFGARLKGEHDADSEEPGKKPRR